MAPSDPGIRRSRRTFEAVARACCPPMSDTLLSATVDETEMLVDALGSPGRNVVAVAARTLEALSRSRRFGYRSFSELDPDEASATLDAIRRDRPTLWRVVSLLRDLVVVCYYEQPEVREAIGYEPDAWI